MKMDQKRSSEFVEEYKEIPAYIMKRMEHIDKFVSSLIEKSTNIPPDEQEGFLEACLLNAGQRLIKNGWSEEDAQIVIDIATMKITVHEFNTMSGRFSVQGQC